MPDLIDIGLNLTHDSFDTDRDSVIDAARQAGVRRMIATGTSVTESAKAVELSVAQPDILSATAGIHPHHASEFDAHSIAALEALVETGCVVAVGECGLDYFRDFSPRSNQQAAFEAQLALAARKQLPVFLHQRDAHADMLQILRGFQQKLCGGVAHCFTGNREQMDAYLELGLHIGITGWVCDERRGEELRQAVPHLPLERLLLETDAPYLLPRDLKPRPRNRRNLPQYLPWIAERVAVLMQLPVDAVARAATANTERLFRLKP